MADGRKAGEHAGQIRDVQAAPDRAHAAQPILRGAHQVERRAGENAHFPVRGEQPQQGGHARAVRNQPPGGAEVIALGVEGIGLAAGKRLRVVFAEGDGEAHAVAVGQIRPGSDAAGDIAGADGKRREDERPHDIVKRAVCRALHRRARRARAEVGIMKGLAGSGGQPVVGVFQQLAQGAALLHAARAVIPLVADGGGMGEQHAQGDGHIRKAGIADGIAETGGKIVVQPERAALDEGHHQLADGGDSEAGFLRHGDAPQQARRAKAKRLVRPGRAAQHDARAQRAILFQNGFHGQFEAQARFGRHAPILAARENGKAGERALGAFAQNGQFLGGRVFQGTVPPFGRGSFIHPL